MKATPRRAELIAALTEGHSLLAYVTEWIIRIERVPSPRTWITAGYDARYVLSLNNGHPTDYKQKYMHWKGTAAAAIALASKWYLVGDGDWTVLPLPLGADAS